MLTIAWLLLTTIPYEAAITDRVTAIEVNHFYDEQGKLVFEQHIFLDWNPVASRYDVRDWRLKKGEPVIVGDNMLWTDEGRLRRVRFDVLRESWTQYDPELVEREVLSKEQRKELTRPPRRD